MSRRSRRVLPAVVLAVILFALCVAVVVSLVGRLTGAGEFVSYDTLADLLYGLTWNEVPVLVAGAVAVALGALLLGIALWPGVPAVLPLSSEDGIATGVTRGGLRSALRSTARSVDGVESARIRLRRRSVKVSARTDRTGYDGMADVVCDTLTRRLQQIGPPSVRRVRAKLRGPVHGQRTGELR